MKFIFNYYTNQILWKSREQCKEITIYIYFFCICLQPIIVYTNVLRLYAWYHFDSCGIVVSQNSFSLGLIKHGCNSGSVTITLSNNGWNAYKPEDYGNTITIVRNITTTSSSYKIYNQWGMFRLRII